MPFNWLLKGLTKLITKASSKLRIADPYVAPVDSPYKGPVMRKDFHIIVKYELDVQSMY